MPLKGALQPRPNELEDSTPHDWWAPEDREDDERENSGDDGYEYIVL